MFFFTAIIAITVLPLYCVFSGTGPSEKEKAEIMENGIKATATLISVEWTGNVINYMRQYRFDFRIMAETGEAFDFSQKKTIDPIFMGNIKKGVEIPAYVGETREDVVILWEEIGVEDAF